MRQWIMIFGVCGIVSVYADVAPSSVSTTPHATTSLSQKERDLWINKAQDFLNGIKTLKSDFVQLTYHPNGLIEARQGSLKWLLPAHIRFVYHGEPYLEVASDGVSFRQKDEDGLSSAIDIDSTPAGLILKKGISFRKDAVIKDVLAQDGEVALILASPEDPKGATLTLIFKQKPFLLTKWSTREPSGRVIQVALQNPTMNTPLSPKEFVL